MKKLFNATMYFLETEEGGLKGFLAPREDKRFNSIWSTTKSKDGIGFSMGLIFEPQTVVFPGTTHTVGIAFLDPTAHNYFKVGDEIKFYAGNQVVAQGKILDFDEKEY